MVIEFRTASAPDRLIATRNLASVPATDVLVTVGGSNYHVSSVQWLLNDSGTTKAIVRIY